MLERELKLAASHDFKLPELAGALGGITAQPAEPCLIRCVYYDTEDLRLARWGCSLRWRSNDGWTVKLPISAKGVSKGGVLVRREIPLGSAGTKPPERAFDLLQAYLRNADVGARVRLRTRRQSVDLCDEQGARLISLVLDEVSVLDGRRVAERFREIEVELGSDPEPPPALVDAVLERLTQAGAGAPDPTPKYRRALGVGALPPPELEPVASSPEPTAAEVIQQALVTSAVRLIRHDSGVRLAEDPEDVHQARVATRRLRSQLRTFEPLLDTQATDDLRAALRELAAALGELRDADVLLERLERGVARLGPDDAGEAEVLLGRLRSEQSSAHERLLGQLRSPAYVELLERLVAFARTPAFRPEATAPGLVTLVPLARRRFKRLRRGADMLGAQAATSEIHELRIRAKHCRYAVEALAAVVGKPARALADDLGLVQDALGEHQDAAVAADWLTRAAVGAPSRLAFVAGELAALERAAAWSARATWPKVWKRVSRSKHHRWL